VIFAAKAEKMTEMTYG